MMYFVHEYVGSDYQPAVNITICTQVVPGIPPMAAALLTGCVQCQDRLVIKVSSKYDIVGFFVQCNFKQWWVVLVNKFSGL